MFGELLPNFTMFVTLADKFELVWIDFGHHFHHFGCILCPLFAIIAAYFDVFFTF